MDEDHYSFLAETIFHRGISKVQLEAIADYADDKSFDDLLKAFSKDNPAGARGAESGLAEYERRLRGVIKIDESLPIGDFREKVNRVYSVKQEDL